MKDIVNFKINKSDICSLNKLIQNKQYIKILHINKYISDICV
jgi:hypothetical protein